MTACKSIKLRGCWNVGHVGYNNAKYNLVYATKKIKYAGAYNPLYLIRNNEVIEYKATKHPVGKPFDERIKEYTGIEIDVEIGDTIYIFSDGYIDQFNEINREKFKTQRFKDLLISIQSQTMDEQYQTLRKKFIEWKGNQEQIDDVTVLGIRF